MTRRIRLDIALPRPVPAHGFRHPADTDIPALGALMWDAYKGTPDESDAGDGVATATHEISLAFRGEHGPFQYEASFVAEHENRIVAAALVTLWQDTPLLAYLFTDPAHTGRGLARRLVEAAVHALGEQGHSQLSLAVTEANKRARRLYESIGFTPHE
jgi:GNAT superfamily N-acetyltransferase